MFSSWVKNCLIQLKWKLNWSENPAPSGTFSSFSPATPAVSRKHGLWSFDASDAEICKGWRLVFQQILQPWHNWRAQLQQPDQAFCWIGHSQGSHPRPLKHCLGESAENHRSLVWHKAPLGLREWCTDHALGEVVFLVCGVFIQGQCARCQATLKKAAEANPRAFIL